MNEIGNQVTRNFARAGMRVGPALIVVGADRRSAPGAGAADARFRGAYQARVPVVQTARRWCCHRTFGPALEDRRR